MPTTLFNLHVVIPLRIRIMKLGTYFFKDTHIVDWKITDAHEAVMKVTIAKTTQFHHPYAEAVVGESEEGPPKCLITPLSCMTAIRFSSAYPPSRSAHSSAFFDSSYAS